MRPATNRIREIRVKKGWTEGYKFAERVGISGAFLSEIETGKKPGSLEVLDRIAKVLRVSIDTLRASPDPTEENILPAVLKDDTVPLVGSIHGGAFGEEVTMLNGASVQSGVDGHLEIADDSMIPELYAGDLLKVAWGAPVEPNRMVIAEYKTPEGESRLTVKVLVERTGLRVLAPINFGRYSSVVMDENWTIRGVVTETIQKAREGRYARYTERVFGAPVENGNAA